MADNCSNKDINIKIAAITTLGYICEQIKSTGKVIHERLSEQILGSILIASKNS